MSIAGKRLTYWGGWFIARRKATQPLTESQARRRHEAGELYAVLVGDPQRPEMYLNVALDDGHVGVWYLDEHLRHEKAKLLGTGDPRSVRPGDPIFPEEHSIYHYESDDDEIWSRWEQLTMRPDGTGMVVIRDKVKNEELSWEVDGMGDMSDLWVPAPAFGEYGHLVAWEVDENAPPLRVPPELRDAGA